MNIVSRLLGIIILSCDFIKRPLNFNQAPRAAAAAATGKCRRLCHTRDTRNALDGELGVVQGRSWDYSTWEGRGR